MSTNVIEINQLSKYYGKQRGIEDVTFSVKQGEILGFIGPQRSREVNNYPHTSCADLSHLWNGNNFWERLHQGSPCYRTGYRLSAL